MSEVRHRKFRPSRGAGLLLAGATLAALPATPASAQSAPAVNVCTGLTLPRSAVTDILAPVATGIVALNDWFDSVQLGSDKTNLAWTRLLHIGALAWLAIRWLPVRLLQYLLGAVLLVASAKLILT